MSETDSRKKGFTKGRSATFSIDGFSFTIGKKLWIKSDVVWKRWQNKDLFGHSLLYFLKSRLQSQQLYSTVICLALQESLLIRRYSPYTNRSVDFRMWCESVWFLKRPFQVNTTPGCHSNQSKMHLTTHMYAHTIHNQTRTQAYSEEKLYCSCMAYEI